MDKRVSQSKLILGWVSVALSILITCFWAFWGIIENFHEGWYFDSFWQNIGLMFIQYLMPMLAFLIVTLLSIRWPLVGGVMHFGMGLLALWFFRGAHYTVLLTMTGAFLLIGTLYFMGRPRPRKLAIALVIVLPLITIIGFGIEPAWRVMHRFDDGNLKLRAIQGNGIKLLWAPKGPGWPEEGMNWEEAKRHCRYLKADGKSLAEVPQDLWRLPTVEEAVKSMCRQGKHCGGTWNATARSTSYKITPDKESPLWDIHSPLIYLWTSTEVDEKSAFKITYQGRVVATKKSTKARYFSFRAVKNIEE